VKTDWWLNTHAGTGIGGAVGACSHYATREKEKEYCVRLRRCKVPDSYLDVPNRKVKQWMLRDRNEDRGGWWR